MPKNLSPTFELTAKSAVQRLSKLQKKNGSFSSLSWAHNSSDTKPLQLASVFSTALILDALSGLTMRNDVQKICQRASDFLIDQRSSNWSFNYWDRQSPEFKELPYPDDWDDTACSLAALTRSKSKLIDASVLAKIVKLLTATEVEAGGPYRTWIVSEQVSAVWRDVDPIVNCNLGYFLSLHQVTLPNITQLMEKQLQTQNWTSPYYPTPYPFFYFLSKWYQGPQVAKAIKDIWSLQNREHDWGNSLNNALVLSTFCRWQVDLKKLKPLYQKLFKEPGNWQSAPFYTGVNPNHDQKFLAGSEALTIAMCLEAGHLYQQRVKEMAQTTPSTRVTETLHQKIVQQAEKLWADNAEFQPEFKNWIAKVTKSDPQHQITLLPMIFAQTLKTPVTHLPPDFYLKLGVANLLGWMAYTIYDNFLDEEAQPSHLPIANICLRYLTQIFCEILPSQTGFPAFFHRVMNQLESANLWEVTTTRLVPNPEGWQVPKTLPQYPDYQQLAQKSLAHALGPIAVLVGQGYQIDAQEVLAVWKFFTHYLRVRQLNDDLHDWKTDLLRGQLNVVSSHLLKKSGLKSLSTHQVSELEKEFWLSEIETFCADIRHQVTEGHNSLAEVQIFETKAPWEGLLNKYLQAAETALEQRNQTLEFWQNYQAQH